MSVRRNEGSPVQYSEYKDAEEGAIKALKTLDDREKVLIYFY